MRTRLISFLEDKRKRTDGHCGTTVAQLRTELDCDLQELKDMLNQLMKQGLIETKSGIHGRMVFYKTIKQIGL